MTSAAPARPFVDRYGFRYTEAMAREWGPRLIAALGIKRAKRSPQNVADDGAADARARLREWARTV